MKPELRNAGTVSIVIPNKNNARFLRESINSALNQTYSDIECIVVDDGSEDESLEILSEFEQVQVYKSNSSGASAARNLGMRKAKGEFIAFLDSDDVWVKNKLELQLARLRTTNHGLVYCGGETFGHGIREVYVPIYEGDCYRFFKEYPTRAIVLLGGSSAVFRSDLVKQNEIFFDESFMGAAEDFDFFRRLSKVCTFSFVDEPLVKYRRHTNNVTNRNLKDFYVGNIHAVRKLISEDRVISLGESVQIWTKLLGILTKSTLKRLMKL